MIEEWKVINKYDGRYSVSNFGNIKDNKIDKILNKNISKKENSLYSGTTYEGKYIRFCIKNEVYLNFIDITFKNRALSISNIDGNILNNRSDNLYLKRKYEVSNKYKILDNYVVGSIKNKDTEYIIDFDDYEKIKDMCWSLSDHGYIKNSSKTNGNTTLHRFIMNCKKGEIVDHINRNRLDNRKENLRIVSCSQNNYNQSINSLNTSGIIGVAKRLNKTKNRGVSEYWRAQIKYNGKHISKQFKTKEEAIKWRLQKEAELFGIEFSPQRHLFEEYGIK